MQGATLRPRGRISLIDHGAIDVEPRLHFARSFWEALEGVLIQFDADAGSIGNDQESIFDLQRRLDDLALWGLALSQGVLLDGEVGNARGKL